MDLSAGTQRSKQLPHGQTRHAEGHKHEQGRVQRHLDQCHEKLIAYQLESLLYDIRRLYALVFYLF
jgi:hypothetical protein